MTQKIFIQNYSYRIRHKSVVNKIQEEFSTKLVHEKYSILFHSCEAAGYRVQDDS